MEDTITVLSKTDLSHKNFDVSFFNGVCFPRRVRHELWAGTELVFRYAVFDYTACASVSFGCAVEIASVVPAGKILKAGKYTVEGIKIADELAKTTRRARRATKDAAQRAPVAERLFTSRMLGVDSKLFGHSYARGESGLLNRTGSRMKLGLTSSGELGGGWHLRVGAGRSSLNANQARAHWDFGATHVPNSVANDLLGVIRELNGL